MAAPTWTNGTRRLSELVPWERNPRQIKRDQAKRLGQSLDEYGQVDVIAIGPDNEVYNGHQRLNVWAADHGPDFEVAVRVSSRPLTEKEREKLVVLLHRGATGEWDFDALANEFELDELLAWGFEARDLDLSLWHTDLDDPGRDLGERRDELQEKWQVARGQVWRLGRHRLLCGDATVATDVERLLGGEAPALTITDPPYGVEYDPKWRLKLAQQGGAASDARLGEIANDDRVDWQEALVLAPGQVLYCWHAGRLTGHSYQMIEAAGYEIRNQIIWVKPRLQISRGHYHWRHEPCWYAVRKGKTALWIGDRKQTTIWEVPWDGPVDGGHSCQKPVECFARALRNHAGDVYDPFVGSGTALVAAQQEGRTGYAIEIDPPWCAVTIERMQMLGLEVAPAD